MRREEGFDTTLPAAVTASSAKPPSLLREELKRAWRELRGADATPGRTALAVAIGLFVGCQPAFGTHTPVVLAVCLALQLDAALAWVAANVSIPPIAVFLVPAEVQVGSYVLTGETLPFAWSTFAATGLKGVALFAFTGSAIIGAALASAAGLLVYGGIAVKRHWLPAKRRTAYRLPESAPAWWHAAERIGARYVAAEMSSPAERSRFHYVRVKMLMDPVSKMVADLFDEGASLEILDIGTGRGQLPLLLLELGRARRAHGIDWDEEKIGAAQAAALREPPLVATFRRGDVRDADLPVADAVLLIDVLHYLTIAEQDALLARAARAVRTGGRLIVREADTERGWRSWLTLLEELIFTALKFNRGARVRFRPAREIVERLEHHGLRCEVRPAWGKTPFCNVLVIATRPSSDLG
jgi:2-polyprenyl-3-methyl-5-hydroxy-6-metoxy-1,4-benzoquinol methylase/uncharacterized protein (DUF2062 family)